MNTVAYCNPLVPVEWLGAHGLQPRWLRLPRRGPAGSIADPPAAAAPSVRGNLSVDGRRGVCPLAAAAVDAISAAAVDSAVVLTTCCDQMRYAACWLERRPSVPVFTLNVPSTWQTPASRGLYLAELQRLGRFLVSLGGRAPANEELARVIRRFERARAALLAARLGLSASAFAAGLLSVREDANFAAPQEAEPDAGLPLALVGGPVPEADYVLFDWIRHAGGRIVLDATEWGERTLPRAVDVSRMQREPLAALADAYFGSIPDVFRRPNTALYEYLGRELAARKVQGLILRRFLWCDLWHAEVAEFRAWSPVPVLDLDAADSEASSAGRTRGRIEAFLEMLR